MRSRRDTDIAAFVLHPIGLAALVIVGAVSGGAFFARTSLLMVIGFGAAEDRRVTYLDALRYVARRASGFVGLAGPMIVRLLLLSAPFLAAVGGVYLLFLGAHDINYYLTARPPEFWTAIVLAGLILGILVVLVLRLAAAWILVLPLFLFGGISGSEALRNSKRATAACRWRIVFLLIAWLVSVFLVSTFVSYLIGRLGGLLIPDFGRSLALVATGLAVTLLLAGLANLTVRIVSNWLLPLGIVRLYRALAGPGRLAPPISEPASLGARATLQIPGKAILGATAAALIVVLVSAYAATRSIDPEDFAEIIAHRGASNSTPENTMAAFEQANADGAEWIEIDVQENADAEVIVAHDSDFLRQAGVNLKVWDSTNEELRHLDVGSWFDPAYSDERVPTLREVLEWATGRSGVVIELKYYGHDQDLESRVVDVVEETGMESDIMVMSLKRAGLRKIAELRPTWTRGLLNTASVGDLTRLDVDFLALNAVAATRAQIRRAHERGMKVYVWTVNDPVQMSVMLSRGADGIITDKPALARKVLELRAELSPLGHLIVWIAGETGLLHGVEATSDAEDA